MMPSRWNLEGLRFFQKMNLNQSCDAAVGDRKMFFFTSLFEFLSAILCIQCILNMVMMYDSTI